MTARFARTLGFGLVALALSLAPVLAYAGTLTVQNIGVTGLKPTFVAASSGGDTFANSHGDVVLLFRNGDTAATTCTVAPVLTSYVDGSRGTVTVSSVATVVPKAGACEGGTNDAATCSADSACPGGICALGGGVAVAGPFPFVSFTNANQQTTVTYSSTTSLFVAAVRVPK